MHIKINTSFTPEHVKSFKNVSDFKKWGAANGHTDDECTEAYNAICPATEPIAPTAPSPKNDDKKKVE